MDIHADAERPATAAGCYGPGWLVPDPTDPQARVNAGIAEDIKDALAEVVLVGFRGVPPNEAYRMTAAILADVCGRVLTHLPAHLTSTPANHQRAACHHTPPRVRKGVIPVRIRLTANTDTTDTEIDWKDSDGWSA